MIDIERNDLRGTEPPFLMNPLLRAGAGARPWGLEAGKGTVTSA